MPYTYPKFATVTSVSEDGGKRYSLEIRLDPGGTRTCVVIQKNPSRANRRVSDHTINRVLNYIHRNRDQYPGLKHVGKVVFLNLIPWYETYSNRLVEKRDALDDLGNTRAIRRYLGKSDLCIIAWGNPPAGLARQYNSLAEDVLVALRKHGPEVYHVGQLTGPGHPRHGMIWGYGNPLFPLQVEK